MFEQLRSMKGTLDVFAPLVADTVVGGLLLLRFR